MHILGDIRDGKPQLNTCPFEIHCRGDAHVNKFCGSQEQASNVSLPKVSCLQSNSTYWSFFAPLVAAGSLRAARLLLGAPGPLATFSSAPEDCWPVSRGRAGGAGGAFLRLGGSSYGTVVRMMSSTASISIANTSPASPPAACCAHSGPGFSPFEHHW